ncbi:F-box/kelch-repeat protein-like protein [Tanacetum coccineum]
MSDNIPYEIQMEIIKKVPDVKSLIRFRSVSKQWKSFIDSSEFITSYCARDTQPQSLLLRYIDNVDEVKYVSFADDVTFPQQQQDFAPNVPLLVKQLYNSKVIGSSYGLWCFHGYKNPEKGMVVIWNPSIRKYVGIVMPRVLSVSGKLTHFGFGVSPSTYDPTIVVMSRYSQSSIKQNITWEVGILTLSSKTWKMIPTSNLPRESIELGSATQVAIDRFIFWVAIDKIVGNDDDDDESFDLILSFDLITREFKEVNLPDSIANEVESDISISKLNESLVVCAYANEVNDGRVYGVWMMGEEGGVMTSFTKLFNIKIPDSSSTMTLLGFRKSGQPIMETGKEDEEFAALEVYEPCSEHISNLGIYEEKNSLFICPYKETLLLVDH